MPQTQHYSIISMLSVYNYTCMHGCGTLYYKMIQAIPAVSITIPLRMGFHQTISSKQKYWNLQTVCPMPINHKILYKNSILTNKQTQVCTDIKAFGEKKIVKKSTKINRPGTQRNPMNLYNICQQDMQQTRAYQVLNNNKPVDNNIS